MYPSRQVYIAPPCVAQDRGAPRGRASQRVTPVRCRRERRRLATVWPVLGILGTDGLHSVRPNAHAHSAACASVPANSLLAFLFRLAFTVLSRRKNEAHARGAPGPRPCSDTAVWSPSAHAYAQEAGSLRLDVLRSPLSLTLSPEQKTVPSKLARLVSLTRTKQRQTKQRQRPRETLKAE
ncbi:hypothetical protein DFH11DRAFT_1544682 [Phellopilus nigrolimitatus]|nr:hypothetical protein DFH11DRAFT_1544682 [Phellopilus nigrolimitatus]